MTTMYIRREKKTIKATGRQFEVFTCYYTGKDGKEHQIEAKISKVNMDTAEYRALGDWKCLVFEPDVARDGTSQDYNIKQTKKVNGVWIKTKYPFMWVDNMSRLSIDTTGFKPQWMNKKPLTLDDLEDDSKEEEKKEEKELLPF